QIPGPSQFTLRLTVTDDQGAQDTKEVALATAATPLPPAATPDTTTAPQIASGGGGGGRLGWEVFALALLALFKRGRLRPLTRTELSPHVRAVRVNPCPTCPAGC